VVYPASYVDQKLRWSVEKATGVVAPVTQALFQSCGVYTHLALLRTQVRTHRCVCSSCLVMPAWRPSLLRLVGV